MLCTCLIIGGIVKKLTSLSRPNLWLIATTLVFIGAAIILQYAIDPYTIQVDRWSAIHNFLATMLQGNYPYGATTHLGGYGSPFPVWQILHLPLFFAGNVGLSIFLTTIAFIATLYHCHSSKIALIATILLALSPAFWYEIAVRSDLITNMMLIAIISEWLIYKKIKLSNSTIPIGILAGLILSTRLIAIIPICVLYGYEFLKMGWKKQVICIVATILTFTITFLPFVLWNGSTLFFFEYNPFVLQTRQGSYLVLLIFAIIAITITLHQKGNTKYLSATTGLLLTILVVMAFAEKMWMHQLWNGLFTSAFDITYLSAALPFYIAHLSRSFAAKKQVSGLSSN